MTDFYSVLKNSIVRRDLRSSADRLEVYGQAREAMIRKLWSFNPPLAEDEIDTRIGLFDEAVEKIEGDLQLAYAEAEAVEVRRSPRREPPAEPLRQPLIYEGYDEEADYVPAFGGRVAAQEASYARSAPPFQDDGEDELRPARHGYERYWEDIDEPVDEEPYRSSREGRQQTGEAWRPDYKRRLAPPEPIDDAYTADERSPFYNGPREDAAYVEPDDDYQEAEYEPPVRRAPAFQAPDEPERARRRPDLEEFTEGRPTAPVEGRAGSRNPRSRWNEPVLEPTYEDYEAPDERYAALDRGTRRKKKSKPNKAARAKRDPVRMLIMTIAGLAAVLIGFNAYVFLPIIFGPGSTSHEMAPAAAETPEKIDDRVPIAAAPAGASARIVSDGATASEIPERNLNVVESLVIFDGRDPTVFEGTSNNPIQFDSDADGGFGRISSATSAAGARVVIGPGLAERLAGQTIRVTLLARSSVENGAASLRFAYQTGLAISHWQSADLSSTYGAFGMIWRVPAAHSSAAGDYLLIEPGIPGDGTSTDIRSIKIDVLAP